METSSNPQDSSSPAVVWTPSSELKNTCALARFIGTLQKKGYGSFETFEELHRWSVKEPQKFWTEVVHHVGIVGEGELHPLWAQSDGPTPLAKSWFPNFRLNFAENIFRSADDSVAITAWSEDRLARKITRAELKEMSLSVAGHLSSIGVKSRDRVFAYLPNIPEAIVCLLGSAAIGATWASCGTDYQVDGLLARLGRVKPKVFVAPSTYLWRGKEVDATATIAEVVRQTPSVEHVILVDYLGKGGADTLLSRQRNVGYSELARVVASKVRVGELERFSFSHPLYIMFSSGTTGKPKAIVHGAGGTLLEHKKEHILHSDVRPGDVLFYQTSTSWMMWNWLVSGLAADATIALYDGDPLIENGTILWRMAEEERVSHFGTSAAFLGAIERQGVRPNDTFGLPKLRALLSTGSTLYPSQFDYITASIKPLWIQSISGGTDIIGCFGLGNPLKPVVRGEVQGKSLGYDVCVYGSDSARVVGQEGELICANPTPSMPIYFLDDPQGDAYRGAYFSEYPKVWRHGDFLEETAEGGLLFLGRSDATLKPAGVRVATADIYAALQKVSAVHQALAVGYVPPGATSEKVVLFVVLGPNEKLTDAVKGEIKDTLRRSNAFYVPAVIVQAPEVPRTSNNKLSELSVKRILQGDDPGNASALANPQSLEFFNGEGLQAVKGALG
jgi:acetoacetyl-CoA synthetase